MFFCDVPDQTIDGSLVHADSSGQFRLAEALLSENCLNICAEVLEGRLGHSEARKLLFEA